MSQKNTVTSGTLFSIVRAAGGESVRVVMVGEGWTSPSVTTLSQALPAGQEHRAQRAVAQPVERSRERRDEQLHERSDGTAQSQACDDVHGVVGADVHAVGGHQQRERRGE